MNGAPTRYRKTADLPVRGHFLDALAERVLVFDGAMGTAIEDLELPADAYGGPAAAGCKDILALTAPTIVEQIHASFLAVGCDVVQTNSFQASRLRLSEWGLGERTAALNHAAAQLARQAADRYATFSRPRFVAGSIGPSGKLPSANDPALSDLTYADLVTVFVEQAHGLVAGGVDLLIIETTQDLLELKAIVTACHRLWRDLGFRVPIQAQVTLDTAGRMLLGADILAALTTITALPGVDVVGLNCSTGPEHMREPARLLAERSPLPIAIIPNAGLPLNVNGRAVYPMAPEAMARAMEPFVHDLGVGLIGGCCGTTPEHLRLMVEAVGGRQPPRRAVTRLPALSSGVRAVTLRQEPAPLLVGERVNATGSRAVKRLLLADDYDGILAIAREQTEGSAHALDVSVALTERADEAEQMAHVVKTLTLGVEAPLVIDSTEPTVLQTALERYPGRALLNSINLEDGRRKLDAVLPLVVEHGAAVVALTIDEEGMARTAARKLAVARRIHDIAVGEYGLAPADLVFDVLTFPLTTGQEEYRTSAVETLAGIRAVKDALPGAHTMLGVSNLSFGVAPAARRALNSVFLHHAVAAGLDLAIINAAQVMPYHEIDGETRALCEDLIFHQRDDALARLIAAYDQRPASAEEEVVDRYAGLTIEERIHAQILHRRKEGIEEALDQALVRHTPVEVLNTVLLPAMKEVGDRFGAGELILPFVLQSAEVMKRAVAHLEQFLEKREGYSKGTIVLATVFGDVHDIGKNLVHTILANNGYTVHDLGKQVPITTIIDKAVEVGADAIGLSALLVSTSKQMPLCVQELDRRGLHIPVIIGGAAINRAYGHRALYVEEERPYAAGVFYAKDAFEGLSLLDRVTDDEARPALLAATATAAAATLRAPALAPPDTATSDTRRSDTRLDVIVPAPPFWGWQTISDAPLAEVFACMDLNTLYRLHWGGKAHGAAFERLIEEDFGPRRARMEAAAIAEGWLQPRVILGYFPCQADGNDLLIYDPAAYAAHRANAGSDASFVAGEPVTRFRFPRRPDRDRLCLADYFQPVGSGRIDVVAFQVVTVGERPSALIDRLQQAGDYSEAYFLHGLAMEAAEGLAEWANRRIKRDLGLTHAGGNAGLRYSWGYPACPDLDEHARLFQLLPVEEQIGVRLTDAFQLVPEASTAALIVHHPDAKYFSVRPSEHAERPAPLTTTARAPLPTDAPPGAAPTAPTAPTDHAAPLVTRTARRAPRVDDSAPPGAAQTAPATARAEPPIMHTGPSDEAPSALADAETISPPTTVATNAPSSTVTVSAATDPLLRDNRAVGDAPPRARPPQTRISELLLRPEPLISFEFFPPKTAAAERTLAAALPELVTLRPDFVSVTSGAGGATDTTTRALARSLAAAHGLTAMAHLTCVGQTRDELRVRLQALRDAGLVNVLALRGDPPRGDAAFTPAAGGLAHAADLVRFMRAEGFDCAVGAACYPEGHLEADDRAADLAYLQEKVAAGVDFLITQMFFDNAFYFDFVARARAAGITVPIIAGVLPVTDADQARRMTRLCGATIPTRLALKLEACATPAEASAVGIAWAAAQCQELIERGAPGLHFYTLNRGAATAAVLATLGRPVAAPARTPVGG